MLCRDEDFVATGSVDKSDVTVVVEDSAGASSVVELVPSAAKVVYTSSNVPLIPTQSTLKEPMLMLVQRLVGTKVALLLQKCVFGPEYVVTVWWEAYLISTVLFYFDKVMKCEDKSCRYLRSHYRQRRSWRY